jgi:hypothetical protein
MKSGFLQFVKNLIGYTAIIVAIAVGLKFILPLNYFTPALPYLFLFFLAVTIAGYYILVKAADSRFMKFLNYYLLVTLVKLLLFIAVLFIYILMNKWDALPFGISFFILYLVYTAIEVVSLSKYTRTIRQ